MECEGVLCKEGRKIERKQVSQHIASTVQGSVPLWARAYQTDPTLSLFALLIDLATLLVQTDRLWALIFFLEAIALHFQFHTGLLGAVPLR